MSNFCSCHLNWKFLESFFENNHSLRQLSSCLAATLLVLVRSYFWYLAPTRKKLDFFVISDTFKLNTSNDNGSPTIIRHVLLPICLPVQQPTWTVCSYLPYLWKVKSSWTPPCKLLDGRVPSRCFAPNKLYFHQGWLLLITLETMSSLDFISVIRFQANNSAIFFFFNVGFPHYTPKVL